MRDFIVNILVKLGLYKPAVECINRVKFKKQARRMQQYGLEMLSQAEKAFGAMGGKAFLTFGCLLGAYREHGFINYDPDIDLGVMADELPENYRETLQQYGFELYRYNYIKESDTIFEETYLYKNLHLDIFYYFKDGQDYYSIIQRKHETKDWKEANVTDGFPCDRSYVPACDFEITDFLGVKVYVPQDTDGWLRAIYSDSYMTPIKNWNAKDYKTRIVHTQERSYRSC